MVDDRVERGVPVARARLLGLAAAATLLLVGAGPALSATYTPTRFDDPPVAAGCTPKSCSLRQAVIAANASPGDDTINLAKGTYTLTVAGANEDQSKTGDLDVADQFDPQNLLFIDGGGNEKTIIDAGGIDRVLDAFTGLVLTDLALRRGNAGAGSGGGLYSHGAVVMLDVRIESSTAARGGGLYNSGAGQIQDSQLVGNGATSAGGQGGGLYSAAGAALTIRRLSVSGGKAADAGGGIVNAGAMVLRDSNLASNSVLAAGGGGGGNLLNSGAMNLIDTSVTRGSSAGDGGNIANPGVMSIDRATIALGTAANDGGGIVNGQSLSLRASTVSNNSASGRGGGIANASRIVVANSTISDNAAVASGGGLYSSSSAELRFSTLARNSAASGGGISSNPFEGATALRSTVLGYNSGGNCAGGIGSQGNNVSSDLTCPLAQPGDISGVDPLLGPLADNGGPTRTNALNPGSPAIDRAVDSVDTPDGQKCPPNDQRGKPRPVDGNGDGNARCDSGAFELLPTPKNFKVDDDRAQCPDAYFTSLKTAVASADPGQEIRVCPGTYYETVDVNTNVTIRGANPDVADLRRCGNAASAHDDPTRYSVLRPFPDTAESYGFRINANRTRIEGMTVEFFGTGVFVSGGVTGTELVKNVLRENGTGVSASTGLVNRPIRTRAERNCVRGNNEGIESSSLSNAEIKENVFSNNFGHAIRLADGTRFRPIDDVSIRHNTLAGNGGYAPSLAIGGSTNSVVADNDVTGSNLPGILILGANQALTVKNNRIEDGADHGILVEAQETAPSSGLVIQGNRSTKNQGDAFAVSPNSLIASIVKKNRFHTNKGRGLSIDAGGNGGNQITDNELRTSTTPTALDCRDKTTGSGTRFTANTWKGNKGFRSDPFGLCSPR